jgi:hypothetical protein
MRWYVPIGDNVAANLNPEHIAEHLKSNGVALVDGVSIMPNGLDGDGYPVVEIISENKPDFAWATYQAPAPEVTEIDPLELADVLLNGSTAQKNELRAVVAELKARNEGGA